MGAHGNSQGSCPACFRHSLLFDSRMHSKGFRLRAVAGVPLCSPHSAFATLHQQTKCFIISRPYDGRCAQTVSDVVVGCILRSVGFCGLPFVPGICHMSCIFMDFASAFVRARSKTCCCVTMCCFYIFRGSCCIFDHFCT